MNGYGGEIFKQYRSRRNKIFIALNKNYPRIFGKINGLRIAINRMGEYLGGLRVPAFLSGLEVGPVSQTLRLPGLMKGQYTTETAGSRPVQGPYSHNGTFRAITSPIYGPKMKLLICLFFYPPHIHII